MGDRLARVTSRTAVTGAVAILAVPVHAAGRGARDVQVLIDQTNIFGLLTNALRVE